MCNETENVQQPHNKPGGGILNKKTNIQELYENLVQNHKKIILFGIGKGVQDCMKQMNTFLSIVCDNWDSPYYIDDSTNYPYAFDNIINFVEYAVDNDGEKVKKGSFDLEGKEIKVYSPDILNKIEQERYIVLITTRLYEDEIKRQILNMNNNLEQYGFYSDLCHYEKKNRGLIAERIIIPYMELIRQSYYQKNSELSDKEEYERLIGLISAGKYVNNIIGFEITTVCNLNCRNCGDYIPRLKKHQHVPTEIVLRDIDTFFEAADLVFCVTLVSGEVLFHPGIKQILKRLLSIDKVERIDLVTNGIRYPEDEELFQLLKNKKIMVHMSNYNMPEKTDISRKIYTEHEVDIRFMEEQVSWRSVDKDIYNRQLDRETLEKIYLKCSLARYCPQIIKEGKIYLCGRAIRYKQISAFDSVHDYCDMQEKRNIKDLLLNLKLESFMDACNWCDWADAGVAVNPGEQ